ncbi:hypothetical protein RRF57_007669 [Xylaria bambusicola]|uniref:Uncharacterized protein n=1 Tax=Xylaria bambusicola TaxID=326684 RepID=A0AAN7Z002_9PEZI
MEGGILSVTLGLVGVLTEVEGAGMADLAFAPLGWRFKMDLSLPNRPGVSTCTGILLLSAPVSVAVPHIFKPPKPFLLGDRASDARSILLGDLINEVPTLAEKLLTFSRSG